MKTGLLLPCLLLCIGNTYLPAQIRNDSVTIRGRITDYEGNPQDSVAIEWRNTSFGTVAKTQSDKAGNYRVRIPKGKYVSVTGVKPAKGCR